MKQNQTLKLFSIFAFTFYVSLNLFYFIFIGKIYPIWFSLALFLIGIYLLLKCYFFGLDSSLWLGMFLCSLSLLGLANYIYNLTGLEFSLYSFLLASIISLIVAIFFKNFLIFKISLLLLLETILFLLYIINVVNLIAFVILNTLYAMLISARFYYALKIRQK